VAEVLSTISGRPTLSASACDGIEIGDVTARIGDGFAEDGAGVVIHRRLDRARSSKSTNLADQPKRLIVWLNWVIVPP
jgi:hypothetical protein